MWEWTEDRVETLKKLWAEGHSASICAERLGGVTRNAVIGKAHRLGLAARSQSGAAAHARRAAAIALRKAEAAKAPRFFVRVSAPVERKPMPQKPKTGGTKQPPDMLLVTFAKLTQQQCSWPVGDGKPEDFRFCGLPQRAGSSYCDHHAVVAYAPPRQIRK